MNKLFADHLNNNLTLTGSVIEFSEHDLLPRSQKKLTVFKYKPKVRYRRKNGHRQAFTMLGIDKIVPAGAGPKKPARPRRQKKEVSDGA